MPKKKQNTEDPWNATPREGVARAASTPRCASCGAPVAAGLAACPFCNVDYPGVPRGASCPSCHKVNASRRTQCASCQHDLTRACVHCKASSPLELVACWHCHRPFGEGARPGATTASDPCHVLGTLDDILKS